MNRKKIAVSAALAMSIVGAAVVRFYHLGWADVLNDEAITAFRSLGYIDFFSSPYQTTPWQWFTPVPWWAHLSFHDHPAVVFLLQHWSFLLMGETVFALRLPSAIAGLLAVVVIAAIGYRWWKIPGGLIAGSLMAVSTYVVWISRIGLQESVVIAVSLIAIYLFLDSLDHGKHWRWGLILGLALVTKYTAIVLVPIFVCWAAVHDRSLLRQRSFWASFLLALAVFSPVIIYNGALYQATGHFDLQFSYLFGQSVPAWQYLPGKIQAGPFSSRVVNLLPGFTLGMNPLLSLVAGATLLLGLLRLLRRRVSDQALVCIVCGLGWYGLLLLATGPSVRFISTAIPFVLLLVTWGLLQLSPRIRFFLATVLILSETAYMVNTLLVPVAVGSAGLTYSSLRYESGAWGYRELNQYIETIVASTSPKFSFTTRYPFLEQIRKKALDHDQRLGKKEIGHLFIYDTSMYELATFWIFHRQLVYHGWPVVTDHDFLEQSWGWWQLQGVADFYFFKTLPTTPLTEPGADTVDANAVVAAMSSTTPEIIYRSDGRPVFAVYHWQ